MKKLLTILFLFIVVSIKAQPKKHREALGNAELLEIAIFSTKDSSAVDKLFAKTIHFGWPDGTTESREEAIKHIVNNKSTYTEKIMPSAYNVREVDDSLIVKHMYKTEEKKTDGAILLLSFSIETVSAKENGKWKLFRCQITKL